MAWARLDDRFHEHWKVAEAGLEAVGLWTLCLTWANQARRTSPTPGVVPESVVARFAGSTAKGKRLAARLHQVGMFDAKTPAGWPIHDFTEYLAKYDPKINAENGRKGGRPRKDGNQTANQTASDPVSEPEANQNREKSLRVDAPPSARRNPVPVSSLREESSGPSLRSGPAPGTDDTPDQPNGGKIVGAWIDRRGERPPSRVLGQVAREVRKLLDEDFPADRIDAALDRMDAKSLNPSTLPSLVSANGQATVTAMRPNQELTREVVDDILGPDSETLIPPEDLDPAVDYGAYRDWMRQARADRLAERERKARAVLGQRVST